MTLLLQDLPQEMLNYIFDNNNFDFKTLVNVYYSSELLKPIVISKIIKLYVYIFDTPLKNENGELDVEEMIKHMSFLDMDEEFESDEKYADGVVYRYNRHMLYKQEIEKLNEYKLINKRLAKNIDLFIKKNGSVNAWVKYLYANGYCPLIMNNIEDYHMLKYLFYIGADPNSVSDRDAYTLVSLINKPQYIPNYAELYALIIENGMDIYLKDGDVGENIIINLENDITLREKVLKILNLKTLDELISKYS